MPPSSVKVFEDAHVVPTDESINKIALLAMRLKFQDKMVEEMESRLKVMKAERQQVQENDLPLALDEAGVSSFTLSDGSKIEVKPVVQGTIPSLGTINRAKPADQLALRTRRLFALKWLEEHNHGGLIKTEVVAEFGKGELEEAQAAYNALTSMGCAATIEENVNPQTYSAWARELIEQGEMPPFDELGIFVGRKATVKLPKDK